MGEGMEKKALPAIFEWGKGEHGNQIVNTLENKLNLRQLNGNKCISNYIIYLNFGEKIMGTWEQDWLWEGREKIQCRAIFEWGKGGTRE